MSGKVSSPIVRTADAAAMLLRQFRTQYTHVDISCKFSVREMRRVRGRLGNHAISAFLLDNEASDLIDGDPQQVAECLCNV